MAENHTVGDDHDTAERRRVATNLRAGEQLLAQVGAELDDVDVSEDLGEVVATAAGELDDARAFARAEQLEARDRAAGRLDPVRVEAARLTGMKTSEIAGVKHKRAGLVVTTVDGQMYIVVSEDSPDGARQHGLLHLTAPAHPTALPVFVSHRAAARGRRAAEKAAEAAERAANAPPSELDQRLANDPLMQALAAQEALAETMHWSGNEGQLIREAIRRVRRFRTGTVSAEISDGTVPAFEQWELDLQTSAYLRASELLAAPPNHRRGIAVAWSQRPGHIGIWGYDNVSQLEREVNSAAKWFDVHGLLLPEVDGGDHDAA